MNARLINISGPDKLTYLVKFSIIPVLIDHAICSVQLCEFSDHWSPGGLGGSRQVCVQSASSNRYLDVPSVLYFVKISEINVKMNELRETRTIHMPVLKVCIRCVWISSSDYLATTNPRWPACLWLFRIDGNDVCWRPVTCRISFSAFHPTPFQLYFSLWLPRRRQKLLPMTLTTRRSSRCWGWKPPHPAMQTSGCATITTISTGPIQPERCVNGVKTRW